MAKKPDPVALLEQLADAVDRGDINVKELNEALGDRIAPLIAEDAALDAEKDEVHAELVQLQERKRDIASKQRVIRNRIATLQRLRPPQMGDVRVSPGTGGA